MAPDAANAQWAGSHLLITWPMPEQKELVEKLKQTLGIRVTWVQALFEVEDQSVYQDVDIIATLAALPASRDLCPRLKYCHAATAGTEHITKSPLLTDSSIRWSYASGIHGPTMAEWVFMTYMAFEKRYTFNLEAHRNKDWRGLSFEASKLRDLVGQRVGILGYGSIGRQVARVASAFCMEVLAFTATPRDSPGSKRQTGYYLPGTGDPDGSIPSGWFHGLDKKSLHHFLAQKIDLLVVCVPLTGDTRGLLGREEFAVLAKHSPYGGAFISNVARGDVMVQDELITALKTEGSGVRGAALDVQSPEPLPSESPLWDAPNCFISPHSSSQHNRYLDRAMEILVENLSKPQGDKFINEINVARGY